MKYLYHGSHTAGIQELKAQSKLHGTEQNVVYLTDNIPYALFYIWDAAHNGMPNKHVTGWIKEGIAYYEEQFEDQLKALYQGVSGYLYYIDMDSNIQKVEDHVDMFYSIGDCSVTKAEYIADVYEELLKYEGDGKLKVLRYDDQTEERKHELGEKVAVGIQRAQFYKNNEAKANFMKQHFPKSWKKAETAEMQSRISVRPIQRDEQALLADTSYGTMTENQKNEMISESLHKKHNGRYFELLVVEDAGNCVGFMNLYAHSDKIISCGPEIKAQYRCKGYAYYGERKAFEYAKKLGYTEAVAQVRMTNQASRALHEKLGFAMERVYINKKGNEVCEYRKEI